MQKKKHRKKGKAKKWLLKLLKLTAIIVYTAVVDALVEYLLGRLF